MHIVQKSNSAASLCLCERKQICQQRLSTHIHHNALDQKLVVCKERERWERESERDRERESRERAEKATYPGAAVVR